MRKELATFLLLVVLCTVVTALNPRFLSPANLQNTARLIVMISSDMEEVLLLSDRVAVMCEGRLTGVLERQDCTEPRIMALAVAAGA